jgi:hypothetical protein
VEDVEEEPDNDVEEELDDDPAIADEFEEL